MSKRREFVRRIVPMAGVVFVLPRLGKAETPEVSESDKMGVVLGFRLRTEKVDQARYPKHSNDQSCAKCLHYASPAADMARCDLFNKIVPRTAWCGAFSRRA